ncbi:hypothetical protein NT239_00435 [Chitinibacter sp. SCUT-21]|uniref:hypothetical protein n=1 Tax=Chitinibacter sp. SCUT-21 TaxID=2970891 RepID=UPI0035A5E979
MSHLIKTLVAVVMLGLGACTSSPKLEIPALRIAVENSHSKALAAMRAGDVQGAADWWSVALKQYQALDDWSGQGMARLGLAQSQLRLGFYSGARETLAPMLEQSLFADAQRAQANLQVAQVLTAKEDYDVQFVQKVLDESKRLCASPCVLLWAQLNIAAKMALHQQAWSQGLALTEQLLQAAPESERVERAHAYQQKALAHIGLGQYQAALAAINAALDLDRQLARPDWLLADYRLQLAAQQALNLERDAAQTQLKIDSLCQAMQC